MPPAHMYGFGAPQHSMMQGFGDALSYDLPQYGEAHCMMLHAATSHYMISSSQLIILLLCQGMSDTAMPTVIDPIRTPMQAMGQSRIELLGHHTLLPPPSFFPGHELPAHRQSNLWIPNKIPRAFVMAEESVAAAGDILLKRWTKNSQKCVCVCRGEPPAVYSEPLHAAPGKVTGNCI